MSKLVQFETMTIQELRESNAYVEYELPSRLDAEALTRLEEVGLSDLTKLGRFRLTGKSRLYGVMEGNVFHVLWWDPHHQIYPWEPWNT
ncbi:hypothetical protein [Streptomyces sp. NPDC002386]